MIKARASTQLLCTAAEEGDKDENKRGITDYSSPLFSSQTSPSHNTHSENSMTAWKFICLNTVTDQNQEVSLTWHFCWHNSAKIIKHFKPSLGLRSFSKKK